MDNKIRWMTELDLDAVYQIEVDSFFTPWSKRSILREIIENKLSGFFVLVEMQEDGQEGDVLGYYCTWHILEESNLNRIAVKPARRGEGLSIKLMDHFMRACKANGSQKIFLEVRVDNVSAIALYHRYGFEIIATRKNYYADLHQDAYVMEIDYTVESPGAIAGDLEMENGAENKAPKQAEERGDE